MPIRFEPFRNLTPSTVPPGLSQQFVGVGAGGPDTLFTLNQIAEVIGGNLTVGVTPIAGGAANKFLYDNGGTLEEGTFGSGLAFSNGVLTATGGGGGGRTQLTGNTNYYVSATGNDSNPGTITQPWLTLQHAENVIASTIDLAGFTATVNVGAGTFAGINALSTVGGGVVAFLGNGSSSTIVQEGTNGACVGGLVPLSSIHQFTALRFQPLVATNSAIFMFAPGLLVLTTDIVIDVTHSTGGNNIILWLDSIGAQIAEQGITYVCNGANVLSLMQIESGSVFTMGGQSTIVGNLTINSASGCVQADSGGEIIIALPLPFIVSGGSVTGFRFFSVANGNIGQQGAPVGSMGPDYFPGSEPGFCDQTSAYDGFQGTGLFYPQSTNVVRTVLDANTTFFISATGSDSNDGSSASPWATLQHAMLFIAGNLDLASFIITISVGAGSFTGFGTAGFVGGGGINIVGAGAASTTITNGPNDGTYNFGECITQAFPCNTNLAVNGVLVSNNSNLCAGIYAAGGTQFGNTANCNFAITGAGGGGFFINVAAGGCTFFGASTVTAVGAAYFFNIVGFGGIVQDDATWTISGTPSFSQAFLICLQSTYINVGPATYSGAATGKRFQVATGGVVYSESGTGALGPNFFPGNVAGTCDSSSSYDGQPGTDLTYPQPTTILRTVLTADTTFHVATTGNDSNDGSSGSPWATPQHAADFIAANIDGGGHNIFVQMADGTYGGPQLNASPIGVFLWVWQGHAGAITNVTFNGTGISGFSAFDVEATLQPVLQLRNLQLDGSNGAAVSLDADGLQLNLSGIAFTAANAGADAIGIYNQFCLVILGLDQSPGGSAVSSTLTGSWNIFIDANTPDVVGVVGGVIGGTVVLSGTPSFATGFIQCSAPGAAVEITSPANAFSGAATGPRFRLATGGSAFAVSPNQPGTLGPNFFPGNASGTVDAVSFYDGFPGPLPGINTYVTGHTFAIVDAFARAEYNGTGAGTFTVPGNGTVGFEIGTKIWATQINTGNLTINGTGPVTVHNQGLVGGQWRSALLYKRGTDEWVMTNV